MTDLSVAPESDAPDMVAMEKPATMAERVPLIQRARPEEPVKITDEAGYANVASGKKYIDPTGATRTKAFEVKSPEDYAKIPEGATYLDPEGTSRTKPKFEGIDFTSQALYDMSITGKEKRKALERSYPGKVREDSEGFYIEDANGKFRRPGAGPKGFLLNNSGRAFIAQAAAPTIGAGVGAIGGGAAGGPVGAVAGAAGGGMAGQAFNDVILQLSGVYDRSIGEEVGNLALAGAMGAGGEVVGRAAAAAIPAAKAGVSKIESVLPTAVANFMGAGPELTTARQLAEKGVMVPPSAWAHEAPHLQNVVEVFDPAFRTNKPLVESATKHYETSAKQILDDLGVKTDGKISSPEFAVPTQSAGEKVLQRTLAESTAADRKLQMALEQRKTALVSGVPEQQAQREAVLKASEESRSAATKLIKEGFENIQREADMARKVAGSGVSTGDLWEGVGNKLIKMRQGIGERASKMYSEADQLAGEHLPDISKVSVVAREFRDQLPGDFKAKYPDIVRKLDELAGVTDETGEIVKEAVNPTFGQLHNLRTLLRGNADWYTLSSDVRNGTYKYFSKAIDDALHDPMAGEELKAAAKQLDAADKFYRENIRVFESNQIKVIMKGLEAGEPADPANLYRALVKEGQTDMTRRIRDMVGQNLWSGVKAADTDAMLAASKTLNPGEIDGRAFAKEVLDRHQRNMLEVVHGKEASEQLLAQARAIEQLDGRLAIPASPEDTMTQVVQRARLAAEEAKAVGTKDPLDVLAKETKKLDAEFKRETNLARRNDPLGFLYNKSTGASYAVDRILGDEDLILASAARFGEKSPEFNALRQVYVERVLRGTTQPGAKLEKISPEVQQLMFPGVTLDQMKLLAKEMDFLMERRGMSRSTAGGMSAMSKVENPMTSIPGVKGVAKMIPGMNPAARAARGKFYALVTELMTSPATLRWIEKGLTKGSPEEQEAVRKILQAHLQKGGTVGATTGEALYQGAQQ